MWKYAKRDNEGRAACVVGAREVVLCVPEATESVLYMLEIERREACAIVLCANSAGSCMCSILLLVTRGDACRCPGTTRKCMECLGYRNSGGLVTPLFLLKLGFSFVDNQPSLIYKYLHKDYLVFQPNLNIESIVQSS